MALSIAPGGFLDGKVSSGSLITRCRDYSSVASAPSACVGALLTGLALTIGADRSFGETDKCPARDTPSMPTDIDFRNIRAWDGSQDNGFEELCCQLAALEPVPNMRVFHRKNGAGGDAGVEAYRVLENGDEHGVQAKYFLDDFGPNQWKQLDDSVRMALRKHPRLTRYIVCLPRDLDDPRRDVPQKDKATGTVTTVRHRSKLDIWKDHVRDWQAVASAEGRNVEFVFWGKSELAQQLQRPEAAYAGRRAYWFDQVTFTPDWFNKRLDDVVAAAGPRYTPEVNVQVPEAQVFEGLGRTTSFLKQIPDWYSRLTRSWRNGRMLDYRPQHAAFTVPLRAAVETLITSLQVALPTPEQPFARDHLLRACDAVRSALKALIQAEYQRREGDDETARPPGGDSFLHDLRQFEGRVAEFQEVLEGAPFQAVNSPALLLVGEAGTGKTHLFCDVARRRLERGLPTVVLLGQHFTRADPKTQILQQLDLTRFSWEEVLGALDASAQAAGQRALIMIDALNEGEGGPALWRSHLANILSTIRRLPHLAVAVSCRSSYERVTIPSGLGTDQLLRVEHHGFEGQEAVATASYFAHYGLQTPTVPLLTPEFSNPLFLKIFCKGLQARGLTRLPTGIQGATRVFDQFLSTVNQELSLPERVDYDERQPLVRRTVEVLAREMAQRDQVWLRREDAQGKVDALLPSRRGYQNSLFANLIAEGVLAEDLAYEEDEPFDIIRFPYERFTDHFVVSALLDLHVDPAMPQAAFERGGALASLVTPGWDADGRRGWLEALAVHLPERYGLELLDLVIETPYRQHFQQTFDEAFCVSLPWRHAESITSHTEDLIWQLTNRVDASTPYAALLLTATNPDHPLNAATLHALLKSCTLAQRDASWTLYINGLMEEAREVRRLIDWAWQADKSALSAKAALLAAVTLTWCLSASNRVVRDRATKALVALLHGRGEVTRRLLTLFKHVNDPYVAERLYAATYGVAMGERDVAALGELAQDVYDIVFSTGCPPAHILLRDYARGIIDVAAARGALGAGVDLAKTRPPFPSATPWPLHVPTRHQVEAYREVTDRWKNPRYIGLSTRAITFSNSKSPSSIQGEVTTANKTLPGVLNDSGKCVKPHRPRRERLPVRPSGLFTVYSSAYSSGDFARYQIDSAVRNFGTVVFTEEHHSGEFQEFDNQAARRWVLQRVLEMGWREGWFGQADLLVGQDRSGRMSHMHERIGKKYQWIALHELLARLSDHLDFKARAWEGITEPYAGPWQLWARDIDPSNLVERLPEEVSEGATTWWQPFTIPFESTDQAGQVEWMKAEDDQPDPAKLIEVRDDQGMEWLNLEATYDWTEPPLPEYEAFAQPQRDLWLHLHAYLIPQGEVTNWVNLLKERSLSGGWLPEVKDYHNGFLGEYPWAPAFQGTEPWQEPHSIELNGTALAGKALGLTALRYVTGDSRYDQSVGGGFSLLLPSPLLIEGMGLTWAGTHARYVNADGQVVAYDPAAEAVGPAGLLVRRQAFLDFLQARGLQAIWTVYGERRIIGGHTNQWFGRQEFSALYRWDGTLHGEGSVATFIAPREASSASGSDDPDTEPPDADLERMV